MQSPLQLNAILPVQGINHSHKAQNSLTAQTMPCLHQDQHEERLQIMSAIT